MSKPIGILMLTEENLGNTEKCRSHPLPHNFSDNFIKLGMPVVAKSNLFVLKNFNTLIVKIKNLG